MLSTTTQQLAETVESPPAPCGGWEAIPVPVRPEVRGKFIFAGERKLFIRGTTYGTFRPGSDGSELPTRETVQSDFESMVAHGLNAIRTYAVPPTWLLD